MRTTKLRPRSWAAFALLLCSWSVSADTGLAHSCVANVAGTLDGCPAPRSWIRPSPDSVVLSCPPGTAATDCEWGDAAFQFRRFGDLAANALVNVCSADIPPGPFAPPNRPVVDPACGDPCGCGNTLDRKTNVLKSTVIAASPATFTVTPSTGPAPLTVSIAWNVPGATTCTASGSWSGAKAATGSQNVTGLTATASYKLVCTQTTQSGPGQAVLTWVPPTQNVDGSALTNLAGTRIVYGNSATVLSQTIQVAGASVATYTVQGLNPATWFFAAKAYTNDGTESALSGTVSKTITASSTTAEIFNETRAVTVTAPPVPNPPTGLTVTQPTAYRLDLESTQNTPRLYVVGTVELGTDCNREHRFMTLNRVDTMAVKLNPGARRPAIAWAKCG